MTERIRYRKNEEGARFKVVMHEGFEGYISRATLSCTGCHETCEGYSTGQYEYDPKAMCEIGFGCEGCGYTGKVRHEYWVPFDMTAWSRHEYWVPFDMTAWSRHEREKERQEDEQQRQSGSGLSG